MKSMERQKSVALEARYQISSNQCQQINRLAGYQFDNQLIRVHQIAPRWCSKFGEDLLNIDLMHIGIEANGYVRASEFERFIGMKMKYLDSEYVAYLMTQSVAEKGIHYRGYHPCSVTAEIGPLLECMLSCEDFEVTLYLDIESVDVDDEYLTIAPVPFSDNLRVMVSWSPFETYLDTGEILALSEDDLVLVYPK